MILSVIITLTHFSFARILIRSYIESSFHFALTIPLLNRELCTKISLRSQCTPFRLLIVWTILFHHRYRHWWWLSLSHHVYLFLNRVKTASAIFEYLCLSFADQSLQTHFLRSFFFYNTIHNSFSMCAMWALVANIMYIGTLQFVQDRLLSASM